MTFMDETVGEVKVRIISGFFAFLCALVSVLIMIFNGEIVSGVAVILLSSHLILIGINYASHNLLLYSSLGKNNSNIMAGIGFVPISEAQK